MYYVKIAKTATLAFSYKEYQPANLLKGNLKIIKLSDDEAIELESITNEDSQRAIVGRECYNGRLYIVVHQGY